MKRLAFVLLALAVACDSTEPSEPAPDLTGAYTLASYTVDGLTETPPLVRAALWLSQDEVGDRSARGGARFQMRRTGYSGGSMSTSAGGRYAHDATGQMFMSLNRIRFEGTYTLQGDTLIIELFSGATGRTGLTPAAKITWLRGDSM
ncbi:MAG: hypothetical protein F4X60_04125 [Gemmatimonadetes bacterium]|nr:hypothetical protein [Gemmatimonadota bacterium]MYB97727.1 hypothetical protein [Gemmatimonadota bacterium]